MKSLFKISAAMVAAALVLTSCNCTKNMMKMSSNMTATSNPAMLVQQGDKVPADITVTFNPNTFQRNTIIKMTPALVFDGGEILGDPQFVQGERVKDNYTVIKSAPGGSTTFTVNFPYDARAKLSTLEVRIEGKCKKNDFAAITKLIVARGIVSPQDNFNFPGQLSLLPDNFKKSTSVSQSAQIIYLINKANVRPGQLTTDQINLFKDFVSQNEANASANVATIQSKGYASPDGPVKFNDELSQKRGQSASDAMSKQLAGAKFDISAYGEDWDGFQALVQQSNMKDKDLVLQVLKMYSSSTQREQEIRNMSAVFKVLATDILPQLRRTTLVASADVNSRSDAQLLAAAQNDPSSLNLEEALYIAPQIKDAALRVKVYQAAANNSGDARAFNNLAVEQAKAGDLAGAAASLKTAAKKGSDPVINDNMGIVALANGDVATAKEMLSKSNSAAAKATLAFANGDLAAASKGLSGYNLAVAQLTNNDIAAAKSTLASISPATAQSDYLKAVVAARQGDAQAAVANLSSSISKDPAMKAKAKTDAEFTALMDSPAFKALF